MTGELTLEPHVTVTGIVAISLDVAGDALTLHVACSDGSVAVTWWNLSEMPRFLTRVGVDATPRPAGAALQ